MLNVLRKIDLSNKYFYITYRKNGFILFFILSKVIKFPVSIRSWKLFKKEKIGFNKAQKDKFWANYCPDGYFFSLLSFFPYMEKSNNLSQAFISSIKLRIKESKSSAPSGIKLINIKKFLVDYDIGCLESISLLEEQVAFSKQPCHGDFHSGNTLNSTRGMKVIDWDSYTNDGSLYFDLIQYYLYETNSQSWYSGYKELLNDSGNIVIYGIKIPEMLVIAFGAWKIDNVLSKKYECDNIMSEHFINKYTTILSSYIYTLNQLVYFGINHGELND